MDADGAEACRVAQFHRGRRVLCYDPRTQLHRTLLQTFAGRALIAGVLLKLVAFVAGFLPEPFSRPQDLVDTAGDVCVLGGGLVVGFRLFKVVRARLLWRVRRKLILSYVFIGVVPALLIVCFFLLAGLLMLFNVSSYLIQSHVGAVVQETQALARVAASDYAGAAGVGLEPMAQRHLQSTTLPGVSFAFVPAPDACGQAPRVVRGMSYGPWSHTQAPVGLPAWMTCQSIAGLMVHQSAAGSAGLVVRAVELPRDQARPYAVIVDVPLDAASTERLRQETGIELGEVSAGGGESAIGATVSRAAGGLRWVTFLDYTDWSTGERRTATAAITLRLAEVYNRISATPIARLGTVNFGQLLLLGLAIVGGLFLVVQLVAFGMGFGLARSITGSVHELFAGTERVQHGDFTHKIAIHSRDQLGELAESFNSMTASIEDLLRQKAIKERLEQELRIAREIQMSLLPQRGLHLPGLSLSGHCEPAREVGGDYYDFFPLVDGRVGVLIADVAGKGTSAALYMAELKGLMLSLSQSGGSPRQILLDVNRIITNHLDDRSFITATYAVIDPVALTLTYARAGHCPLIFRPGLPPGDRRARLMAPEGLVVGLKIDNGEIFERLLEEATVPLGPGDLFLLFTDGVTEAMNAEGDCFGEARLAAIVEEHGDSSADVLRERILSEVRAFAGAAGAHDDVTMVVVNILSPAAASV